MIRHLLISSAFVLASTVTFVATANAQDASANGPVADMCVFSEPTIGQLAVNDTSNPTVLSSSLAGGTAAQVDITCNGNATLTVSPPIQTEGKTTTFKSLTAKATSKDLVGLNVDSNSTKPGNININTTEDTASGTIEVNMTADNDGKTISPGQYTFTVTLSSTP